MVSRVKLVSETKRGHRVTLLNVIPWIVLGVILSRVLDSMIRGLRIDFHDEDVISTMIKPLQNKKDSGSMASKNTFHVLYGLMGTGNALYDSWEVSLKSILVNAPADADMKIHVICSEEACGSVLAKVDNAGLKGSLWRNEISILLYNVDSYNGEWREFLRQKMRRDELYERISLGGYYRLLAYQILAPLQIGTMLYMDTDVVVISNLNDLMKSMDETKVFQGSPTSFCSGFTILNMQKFDEFWKMVDQLETVPSMDQDIMNQVLHKFPDSYGHLPLEWDRNLGNGGNRRHPHRLMQQKEAAGMLHYQGGSSRHGDTNYFTYGMEAYCDRTPKCRDNEDRRKMVAQSWGLGDFYIRLTWKWALYFGRSNIAPGQKGFGLHVQTLIANHTSGNIVPSNNATRLAQQ